MSFIWTNCGAQCSTELQAPVHTNRPPQHDIQIGVSVLFLIGLIYLFLVIHTFSFKFPIDDNAHRAQELQDVVDIIAQRIASMMVFRQNPREESEDGPAEEEPFSDSEEAV